MCRILGDIGAFFLMALNSRLPLPKEVPMSFRVLPEYIVEDIVDYLFFAVQWVLDITTDEMLVA